MSDDNKPDDGYSDAGKPGDTKEADVAKMHEKSGGPAPLPPAPEVGGKNG